MWFSDYVSLWGLEMNNPYEKVLKEIKQNLCRFTKLMNLLPQKKTKTKKNNNPHPKNK